MNKDLTMLLLSKKKVKAATREEVTSSLTMMPNPPIAAVPVFICKPGRSKTNRCLIETKKYLVNPAWETIFSKVQSELTEEENKFTHLALTRRSESTLPAECILTPSRCEVYSLTPRLSVRCGGVGCSAVRNDNT